MGIFPTFTALNTRIAHLLATLYLMFWTTHGLATHVYFKLVAVGTGTTLLSFVLR